LFPYIKHFLNHEMLRGCKKSGVKKIRVHDLRHPYVKPTTKKFITFFAVFRAAS
ncbi:MAG: site-specific integrase, partial [Blautia wexlerae]